MKSNLVSSNLNAIMKARGVSLKKLSMEVGIPQSTLSSYLTRKKSHYNIEHLLKLTNHFDVSLDFLISGVVNHNDPKFFENSQQINIGYYEVVLRKIPERGGL